MKPRMGLLIGCVSIALTSPAASAAALGPRSELCNKLQKTVAEVTGKAYKVKSLDVKGHPLLCIYSPEEGWQGVNFELPDGDAKKLAEWRANFAKSPNKTMTGLTDLPELGPGAFRANEGGLVHVHGLAKKGLLIVRGGFKADVEVALWKRLASEL